MSFKLSGHLPDKSDPRDHEVTMDKMGMHMDTLPKNFDITADVPDGQGSHYNGHIFNQGNLGSCVTNAVALAYMFELQRQGRTDLKDYKPSRLFLYYVARLAYDQKKPDEINAAYYESLSTIPPNKDEVWDTGSFAREVVKIMRSLGAPNEAKSVTAYENDKTIGDWPYQNASSMVKDTMPDGKTEDKFDHIQDYVVRAPDAKCFEVAKAHVALNYARPHLDTADPQASIKCWKGCIKRGYPVIFGLQAYKSFYDVRKEPFVARLPDANDRAGTSGGHCVLAIGWNDSVTTGSSSPPEGCFLIQNSWGNADDNGIQITTEPGKNGRFWLPYTWFSEPGLLDSPWTFMDVTSS